jgi:hypothetical protein
VPPLLEIAVRLARLVAVLLASGVALLVAAIAISCIPAYAASPYGQDDRYASTGGSARQPLPPYEYTDHARPASTGRTISLYVDSEFPDAQRKAIVSAMRQWNYALNGYVQFRARVLPRDADSSDIARLRRSGAWIVALVDSRNPIAQQGEGAHALAVTIGNGHDGFVYVIGDRIGGRDLTGVIMHEFGHVLGAGHDHAGLMAPVYSAAGARCIDRDAVAMVAQAQHVPLQQLNWCEPAGYDPRSQPRSASNYR